MLRLGCCSPPPPIKIPGYAPAVKSLYSCSEVCVRVWRVKSRQFTVGFGLRQGCLLSPLLFLHELDGQSQRSRGRCHSCELQDQPFASCRQGLQDALDRFSRATVPERKPAPKIPRYYVSPQTKGSVCCK